MTQNLVIWSPRSGGSLSFDGRVPQQRALELQVKQAGGQQPRLKICGDRVGGARPVAAGPTQRATRPAMVSRSPESA